MRKGVKIAVGTAGICLLALVLFAVYGMKKSDRRLMTCTGIRVEFADSGKFVSAEDIEEYLNKEYGAYIGERLDSVDLGKVESILNSKSAILKTEAFTTPDGMLNVKVYQREPAIRFQKGEVGFYADSRGFLFPLQKGQAPTVRVVEGNIPLSYTAGFKGEPEKDSEKRWLGEMLRLVEYQNSSKTWRGFFRRFLVNQEEELVLIPADGKEKFIFGDPEGFKSKFDRVGKYYRAIVPKKGTDYYSTVNVKYKGQIVCRK